MRRFGVFVVAVVTAIGFATVSEPQGHAGGKTDYRVLKYPELCDLIQSKSGKVVLVDMWQTTCMPCLAAMPFVVDMQEKYRNQGLVVISLNLNDPANEKSMANVQKIIELKKLQGLINLVLDENAKFWQEKFRTQGVPCVYVFNREGKWTQLDGTLLAEHEKLEQFVKQLLDQPAPK